MTDNYWDCRAEDIINLIRYYSSGVKDNPEILKELAEHLESVFGD